MEEKMSLKPRRQTMKDIFTCPICNNLYDRATTISECLHTFCRKCIEDKLIEENLRACPICNVDLGVAPLAKLKMDSIMEDMRLKFFKPKPESVKPAAETVTISLQYFRKKKKSLSSLLANSSRVTPSPESNPDAPLEPKKLGEQVEAVPLIQSSSRPVSRFRRRQRKNLRPKRIETRVETEQPRKEGENGFKIPLNIEQNNGLAGAGTSEGGIQKENNSEKDNEEIPISSDDLGKSLRTDKEVTPLKRNDTALIVEPAISPNGKENQDDVSNPGGDTEEVSGEKSKECAEENQNTVLVRSEGDTEEAPGEVKQSTVLVSSDSDTEEVSGEKQPKYNGEGNQENVLSSGKINGEKKKDKSYSPPVLRSQSLRMMDSAGTSQQNANPMEPEKKVEGSNKPVWFSLVAAPDQNTKSPLPQIFPHYLRVSNGNLPVSHLKKYLVRKLSLESEEEVEIWLGEEPVCSTQKVYTLVDWWVQTAPMAEPKSATVGSSAAEFVMALHYSRSLLFA